MDSWRDKGYSSKGANTFPQILQDDSLITLSWLNEFNQNQTIFVQKFKLSGKEIWEEKGMPVANSKNNISNYSLTNDNAGGAFVAWMNNTSPQNECNVNVQRISNSGRLLWDSLETNDTQLYLQTVIRSYYQCLQDLNDQAAISYMKLH